MNQSVILRTNAIPVYGFLSIINTRNPPERKQPRRKILDCGAGGAVPPLALFHQHGFETWGIDASEKQLERARAFCDAQNIDVYLQEGDMRQIPFEAETFDYVYEHYSMCHLSKRDTVGAIGEMYRVLKPGGLCFLGVISADSWPPSFLGQEREPGEFWGEEGGEETLHTVFSETGADELVSGWKIISKEKHVRYVRSLAEKLSLNEWMALHREAMDRCTQAEWRARYGQRANAYQYAHLYYILRKPDPVPAEP